MSDATEHARRLVRGAGRPDVDSIAETQVEQRGGLPDEGPTEQYEAFDDAPAEATRWVASMREHNPDADLDPGVTDVESEKPLHRSKITAAIEVLILAIERLEVRVETRTKAAEEARLRHDRLVETVQRHGSQLVEHDEFALEVTQQRAWIRLILVAVSFLVPAAVLVVVLQLVTVCR